MGARTLQFLEEVCRSLGVRALHLEVDRSNTSAHGLYGKVGYVDHNRYLMTKSVEEQ
ncbi:MAG: GNAT family N-acetyltransferase [Candidatus Binatia bacterium]